MDRHPSVFVLLLCVGTALACGDDAAGPAPDEITGAWTATKVEYVSVSQPVQTVDLIAAGGTATLELGAGGDYTFTLTPSGEAPQVETGTWEVDGDVLTVWPDAIVGNRQFDCTLSGNTLTLSGADADYDFDDDQQVEAAKLNIELVR